jgi:hypothetical protein
MIGIFIIRPSTVSNSIVACNVLTSPGDRSAEIVAPVPSPVTFKFAKVYPIPA